MVLTVSEFHLAEYTLFIPCLDEHHIILPYNCTNLIHIPVLQENSYCYRKYLGVIKIFT
jgi:hypothetical protein